MLNLEMLNLHQYNLKKNVHAFRQGDLFLAYDVNSGSIHVLDESAYQILQRMEELQERGMAGEGLDKDRLRQGGDKQPPELEEILEELAGLKQEGTLFSPEAPEKPPAYPEKPVVKAICLHVAHDCNLRCEYCFAGTGAFGGVRTLMDFETGAKAIDYVLEASGHRTHCEVDFFGGEPLLNFPVVKDLVHYGREAAAKAGKSIKFTLTTNAVLLDDEVQDFLEAEDISVVLSLDGRPEVHDRMRPYADGSGSYEEVVPAIRRFVAKRPESSPYAVGTYYYVRGTYTHFNLDFDRDVLHMADLGIERISLEPVVAGPQDAYAFREEDLEKIYASYDRLGEEILERRRRKQDFNFFHFNVALDQGPCLPKRISGCGAGHEYVAVSPEGDLYPCHQFVGQEQYKLGSLHAEDKVALDAELVQAFRSAHIYAKPACRECWARFACSGGCHAANTAFTGDLNQVYTLGCKLQQKRLEVALYLKVKELQG
ncbi:thioether cross-link-forming SCIFF peptide maturase [Paradesulfitobacterium ferrireducens]|uniref:thioether cross-link-forming SCIFF peptide maturase n=1 Tax=Paradesulfitobacterium ferrireducens TaxID=2816476 RepID=UPI001A8EA5A6|nr:thioether cross-link-forming SCIFF peptide maturase [Paradesulfitobacterium ferrireducens]